MNNVSREATGEKPKHQPATVVAGGCLVVLYLGLCIFAALFIRHQSMVTNTPPPIITPTSTTTPHVLSREPQASKAIRHEDFSSDTRYWRMYYTPGKLEVIDGRLILQSYSAGSLVMATQDYLFFAPASEKYYIQADFATDTRPFLASYGLVFGLDRELGTFYLFEVSPGEKAVRLLKSGTDRWDVLLPETSAPISTYPEFTTLGVYFNEGGMELYVNGESVAILRDMEPLHSKDVGALIDGNDCRLVVDDFFVYDE